MTCVYWIFITSLVSHYTFEFGYKHLKYDVCVSIKTARSDDVMNGDILYQCGNEPIRVETDLIDNTSSCTLGTVLNLTENQIDQFC